MCVSTHQIYGDDFMKLVIASDIHGAAQWCRRLIDELDQHQPDRVILLGDLLYHGPRNNLPADYNHKEVIAMLNSIKEQLIVVRGNCEAEVDQWVLEFPCLAEYNILWDQTLDSDIGTKIQRTNEHGKLIQGRALFCTHGHKWGAGFHNSCDHMPALPQGSALIFGHTHKKINEESTAYPGIWCFNPGSVGLPKDGTHSYGIYEDGVFTHRIWDNA